MHAPVFGHSFEDRTSDSDENDIPEFIFYGTDESHEVYTEILEDDVHERSAVASVIRDLIAFECDRQGIPRAKYCLTDQGGRVLQEDCDEPLTDAAFARIAETVSTRESFEIRKARV